MFLFIFFFAYGALNRKFVFKIREKDKIGEGEGIAPQIVDLAEFVYFILCISVFTLLTVYILNRSTVYKSIYTIV